MGSAQAIISTYVPEDAGDVNVTVDPSVAT